MHASIATTPAPFRRVFQAGVRDSDGHLLGGTEVLHLVPHQGKLFSLLSYSHHRYLPGDPPVGAQVAMLDRADGEWRQVHAYDRDYWRATLRSVAFTQDERGRTLDAPISLLLAGPSNNKGAVYIDCLDDDTGTWARTHLGSGSGLTAARSFFVHRDTVTGQERVFVGTLPLGIFSGSYDPDAPGKIRWDRQPELSGYRRRPMAFTECDGVLYVSIRPHIYRRIDGPAPRWESVHTIAEPLIVPSCGYRGLMGVPRASGPGQVLLAALEGDRCRIVRIDPQDDFRETLELDVLEFLGEHWGARPAFGVVAYDDFTPVLDPASGQTLLLAGVGASDSASDDVHPPDGWARDAWYLIRDPDGQRHTLARIESADLAPSTPLFAARSFAASPFEPGMLYVGGYDPNAQPCRDTAWVFSASVETVLAPRTR
ncbi:MULTISPECIES: hypothetical protein [Xanthomonas]|uniref:hypothetical protein n=1 Tax=Xanthomonas TaxID=338 RepID=UPI001ADCF112|nr:MULTISPECIES: hypothetical protein [unclassified Xanthomonas]MBO9871895.1 hypothetical protein [Xanthomonas sp. D-93]WNH43193.1 hypothetical protein PG878_11610 [Xanthomonas sp. A6251]